MGGTHLLKSYADIMNDISPDELLLAYGLFTEKLPPILSSEAFYNYCTTLNTPFADGWRQYIYHESMRNINVPRPLGIPNPMAYQKLCRCRWVFQIRWLIRNCVGALQITGTSSKRIFQIKLQIRIIKSVVFIFGNLVKAMLFFQ